MTVIRSTGIQHVYCTLSTVTALFSSCSGTPSSASNLSDSAA